MLRAEMKVPGKAWLQFEVKAQDQDTRPLLTRQRALINLIKNIPPMLKYENPFVWLDEVIFLRKEKNFFETRVTEYQTSGSVKHTSEEDLI